MAKKVPDKWVRLSTLYYDDPKVSALTSDSAETMFTRGIAYCGRSSRDGFIPAAIVRQLTRNSRASHVAKLLVEAGLWVPCDDGRNGYVITAWDRWQETNVEVAQRKADDAARQRRSRESRKFAAQTVDVTCDSHNCHSDVTPIDKDTDKDKNNYNYSLTTADAVAVSDQEPPPAVEASTNLALIEPKPKPASKQKTSSPGFDDFWDLYPKKVDKQKALKAFQQIAKQKTATVEEVISGLRKQLPDFESRDPKYVPHPTTWLNAARWDDEPQTPRTSPASTDPKAALRDKWVQQCRESGYFDAPPPQNVIPIWDPNYKEIAS
jgi:hypothetical protein